MTTPFEFVAPVLRADHGMRFHYLPLPDDVADALLASATRRVLVTLNGHATNRAVQTAPDGTRVLVTGRAILRAAGAALGDMVVVTLRPDPTPDTVDVGEALAAALEQDPGAGARFHAMTPGRQRSLAHYVTSAKRPETRARRAHQLAEKLRTYTLHGDDGPPPSSGDAD